MAGAGRSALPFLSLFSPARDHPETYRPDVDGLRALAVLLVVAFHAAPGRVPGGFIGVDVFFVISGYLITGIIVRDLDAHRFRLIDFYARRCRRILPALLLVLLATLAFGGAALFAPEFARLGLHTAAGAGFSSNLLSWSEAGYFDRASDAKPLLHLWSLGVEEQYYLVWPLILSLVQSRRMLLCIAVLGAASFAYCVWLTGVAPSAAFYLLPSRFWELAAGGLLAAVQLRKPTLGAHWPPALASMGAAFGLLLIVLSAFAYNKSTPFPGALATAPVIGSLLLLASGPRSALSRPLLENRLAVQIGLISYPLYLWHWPMLSMLSRYGAWLEIGALQTAKLLVVAASILLAWLTWRFVERPIQSRLTPLSRQRANRVVVSSMIALLLVIGLGLAVWKAEGFPNLHAGPNARKLADLELAESAGDQFPEQSACPPPYAGLALARCLTTQAPNLALYGDSHAHQLLAGFEGADATSSWRAIFLGRQACAPIEGVDISVGGRSAHCRAANDAILSLLERSSSISVVALSFRGAAAAEGRAFWANDTAIRIRSTEAAESAEAPNVLYEGLSRTITRLQAAGKRVVLVIDNPELDFHPETCLRRPLSLAPAHPCTISRTRVSERQARYRAVIAQLQGAHPGLLVFDPTSLMCDSRTCRAEQDGRMLDRDDNHLSRYGSQLVVERLLDALAQEPR